MKYYQPTLKLLSITVDFKSTKQKEESDEMKFKQFCRWSTRKNKILNRQKCATRPNNQSIEDQSSQDPALSNTETIENNQNNQHTIEKVGLQ